MAVDVQTSFADHEPPWLDVKTPRAAEGRADENVGAEDVGLRDAGHAVLQVPFVGPQAGPGFRFESGDAFVRRDQNLVHAVEGAKPASSNTICRRRPRSKEDCRWRRRTPKRLCLRRRHRR